MSSLPGRYRRRVRADVATLAGPAVGLQERFGACRRRCPAFDRPKCGSRRVFGHPPGAAAPARVRLTGHRSPAGAAQTCNMSIAHGSALIPESGSPVDARRLDWRSALLSLRRETVGQVRRSASGQGRCPGGSRFAEAVKCLWSSDHIPLPRGASEPESLEYTQFKATHAARISPGRAGSVALPAPWTRFVRRKRAPISRASPKTPQEIRHAPPHARAAIGGPAVPRRDPRRCSLTRTRPFRTSHARVRFTGASPVADAPWAPVLTCPGTANSVTAP